MGPHPPAPTSSCPTPQPVAPAPVRYRACRRSRNRPTSFHDAFEARTAAHATESRSAPPPPGTSRLAFAASRTLDPLLHRHVVRGVVHSVPSHLLRSQSTRIISPTAPNRRITLVHRVSSSSPPAPRMSPSNSDVVSRADDFITTESSRPASFVLLAQPRSRPLTRARAYRRPRIPVVRDSDSVRSPARRRLTRASHPALALDDVSSASSRETVRARTLAMETTRRRAMMRRAMTRRPRARAPMGGK